MRKILVVEDNEMNRDMLCRRLERIGYTITRAVNGQEALNKVAADPPHLILMDMSLPVLDGWETTRRLKANEKTKSIPIIALTAYASVEDLQSTLEAGCDDYLTKPIDFKLLIKKIESLLS